MVYTKVIFTESGHSSSDIASQKAKRIPNARIILNENLQFMAAATQSEIPQSKHRRYDKQNARVFSILPEAF